MSATSITLLATAYIAHTGLKESTVSSYALNDGKRLGMYREGTADITTSRCARVIRWFDENWPSDLEWPEQVVRPSKIKNLKRGAA
jgi:hypothetical protein